MRNDSHRWTPPGPLSRAAKDIVVTEVPMAHQHIVSGHNVSQQFADRAIAWPDQIAGESYVLLLRRDRVLVVGQTDLVPGYASGTGLAITDVTDAYVALDLTGAGAFATLCRGAELRPDQPSRSVVRRIFGCDVMLCKSHKGSGFRIHAPRALSQAFVEMLVKV